ncbi:MAG TPA: hypothetical protein VH593_30435 [Ktedonobacteraceae bacterium]
MAAFTFFLATSSTKKMLTREEIEALLLELLREQHVLLPAAILVGKAHSEVRGNEFATAMKKGTLLQASHYIIPNAPESMLQLVEAIVEEKKMSPETLWYYGDDEATFVEALRRAPLRERDICFCFPFLSHYLSDACGWDQGAILYTLTHPFPVDFIDILGTAALPLIDYHVSDFFTLSSSCLGSFPDTANNPLKPILQHFFGPDLDMKQTDDLYPQNKQ